MFLCRTVVRQPEAERNIWQLNQTTIHLVCVRVLKLQYTN